MSVRVQRFHEIPDGLVSLVSRHLPYSIPLLRRLQFAKFRGATTEHARVVFASHSPWPQDASQPPSSFSVSYVDVSGGPETQMWLYSTMENDTAGGSARTDSEEQLNAIVQEIVQLKIEFGKECLYPGHVLLGTLHSGVRAVLEKSGRIYPRDTGDYDKWLFKIEGLPTAEIPLPEDMVWDVASLQDCEVVVSRTNLPRKAESLVQYPNLVIKLKDGTPVAWAFLGPDASLTSLHCEEPYRGRGLAKALAAKLFREKASEYGPEPWCSADVSSDNSSSRGVCKSLNGTPWWVVSWVLLNVRESSARE